MPGPIRRRSPPPPAATPTLAASPARVLAALVARGITAKPSLFVSKRGAIGFVLDDDESFTVRLGDERNPLVFGADPALALRVDTHRQTIAEILEGTVDAAEALAQGRLRLEGDLELLATLARLIEPPQDLVGLRAGR